LKKKRKKKEKKKKADPLRNPKGKKNGKLAEKII